MKNTIHNFQESSFGGKFEKLRTKFRGFKIIFITIISLIMVQITCNARNLYTLINPLVGFEDVTLCNSVGVYKNGDNTFNNENNMLDSMSAAGVNLVDANRLKVYPVPATDLLNVEYHFDENEVGEITIYDLLGNKIISQPLNTLNSKTTIDVRRLAQGVYTYKCMGSKQQVFTGKIIIE